MDIRITAKRALCALLFAVLTLLFLMVFAPVAAGADDDFLPPEARILDFAGLFTPEEEKTLNAALGAASASLGVHFFVLTSDDDIDMEDYAYRIYLENVNGFGGVSDCALLSINMAIRESYIDCYGSLRSLFTHDEVLASWELLRSDLSAGDYVSAVNKFIADMSSRIQRKFADFNVIAPEVSPGKKLHDFGGLLSYEETRDIIARIDAASEKTGVAYIVAILNEERDEAYLQRFAVAFYRQNFAGLTEYAGAYMLVISSTDAETSIYYSTRRVATVTPFGTFDPDNDTLWNDRAYVTSKLRYYSPYDACAYFLSMQLDKWHSERIELPSFDPTVHIHDYGNALTDSQMESLTALFEEKSRELNTWLYMVITPFNTRGAAFQFDLDFRREYAKLLPSCYVMLTVQLPPDIVGELPYVALDYSGRLAWNKIGSNARYDIRTAAEREIREQGDFYRVGEAFVRTTERALTAFLPKAEMGEMFRTILVTGLVLSIVIVVLTFLIMRLVHGVGKKRALPAHNYLARNSLSLVYSNDRFVSSHTTSRRIESSSSSGGGGSSSGGSSGGGHSTRAGGSF